MKVKKLLGLFCRTESATSVYSPTSGRTVDMSRHSCCPIKNPLWHSRASKDSSLSRAEKKKPHPASNAKPLEPEKKLHGDYNAKPLEQEKKLHGGSDVRPPSTAPKSEETEKAVSKEKPRAATAAAPLSPSADGDLFRVVVLKVSMHCGECARQVMKNIIKIDGVKSCDIDLNTKRVTVVGHISPQSVLMSVSKVKRAEFWYK